MAEPLEVIGGIGSGIYPRVTQYEVSVFPDWMRDSDDLLTASEARTWCLQVKWAGKDGWIVSDGHMCLTADGEWVWTPQRFPLRAALRMAAEHAPKLMINNLTAMDILAKHQKRHGRTDG